MVLNLRMIVPFQVKVFPANDDELGGVAVNSDRPMLIGEARSGRTRVVSFIAPSTFNSPAPCSRTSEPASFWAVYSINALTMFGVIRGLICNIKAAVPETKGVATDV